MTRLADALVLAVVVAAAAVVHIVCARTYVPGSDEWWHLYFGEIQPFDFFVDEIRKDTHPPLSYLWLRAMTAPGDDPILGRLTSILPSLATLPVAFVWLRGLGVERVLAHAAVIALAASPMFVAIGIVVRSYALATLATVVTFAAATQWLRDPATATRGSLRWLCAGAVVAPWSLYQNGFPLVALGATFGALALLRPGYRTTLVGRVSALRAWPIVGVTTVLLAAVAVWFRMSRPASPTGYLGEFFPPRDADVGASIAFVVRGLAQDLTLFLGVDLTSAPWLAAVGTALVVGYGLVRYATPPRMPRDPARALVFATFVTLIAMLAALALLRRFPFGGGLRHQYVVAPFLWAALLLIVDDVLRRMPRTFARVAPLVVAAVFVALAPSRMHLEAHDNLLRTSSDDRAGVDRLAERLVDGDVVLASTWTRVAHYGMSRDAGVWTRRAQYRDPAGRAFDEIDATIGARRVRWVGSDRWQFVALPDDALAADFGVVLDATGADRLWVFSRHRAATGPAEPPPATTALETVLRTQGFALEHHVTLADGHAYAIRRS